jgi:hypothetical protein
MPSFQSTYFADNTPCRWLRGNHHGHSTASDGQDEPAAIIASYEDAGYSYLALSEHDFLLPVDDLQPDTRMTLIPAVEVTSAQIQTLLHLNADQTLPARQLTPKQIMDQVHGRGGLFVFNHSNWKPRPDYATDAVLDTMDGMRGMEIYCGVIERLAGQALATDRWDRLLSRGWRVFGHGTDDQHQESDQFIAWNCVQWPQTTTPTPAGIVSALAAGRFYASTGVTISRVGAAAEQALVESDADEVRWVSRDGAIVHKTAGGASQISLGQVVAGTGAQRPQDALYVRAECLGRGNAMAWTQPFFIVPGQ